MSCGTLQLIFQAEKEKVCQIIQMENFCTVIVYLKYFNNILEFSKICFTSFSLCHPQTPMNQASTRSHCIFTMHICRREPGSATLRQSKLHLVDLAGSDRVSKTGLDGQLLTEAKYINLSLHYLEQVVTFLY